MTPGQKAKKKYRETYPWRIKLSQAKTRCNNKKDARYKWYGEKGIEFHLTMKEGEILWNEAKAWLMRCPSIDRKNKRNHYTFDNCQFIEFSENSGKDKKIPILQFDLKGKFIKEWPSIIEASKKLKLDDSCICYCCKGHNKYTGKYIFKYKT